MQSRRLYIAGRVSSYERKRFFVAYGCLYEQADEDSSLYLTTGTRACGAIIAAGFVSMKWKKFGACEIRV